MRVRAEKPRAATLRERLAGSLVWAAGIVAATTIVAGVFVTLWVALGAGYLAVLVLFATVVAFIRSVIVGSER